MQNTGHSDYGQHGYPQQYAFPTGMQAMQSGGAHDMSKQQGQATAMYQNPMVGPSHQHHQPQMQQQGSLMQSQQAMSRGPMTMQRNYSPSYRMPQLHTMSRNIPLPNQPGPQQASQFLLTTTNPPYGANVPHMALMRAQYPPNVYNGQMGPFNPYQNDPQHNQIYLAQYPGFGNIAADSNNGYYQPHTMSPYNTVQQQMQPRATPQSAPPPATQREKKPLAIVDPNSGKNIMDELVNTSARPTPEKEIDAPVPDPTVVAEFATQVARAADLTKNSRSEIPHDQILETAKIPDSPGPMKFASDMNAEDIGEPLNEQVEIESTLDPTQAAGSPSVEEYPEEISPEETPSMTFYGKDVDSNSSEQFDIMMQQSKMQQPADFRDLKSSAFESEVDSVAFSPTPVVSDRSLCVEPSITQPSAPEIPDEAITEDLEGDVGSEGIDVVQSSIVSSPSDINLSNESSVLQEVSSDASEATSPGALKVQDGKKKPKKKKDLNKRGESKDGGEMDAFLDAREDASEVPSSSPQPPASRATPSPPPELEPQSATIRDPDVLAAIPLPGEGEEGAVPCTEEEDTAPNGLDIPDEDSSVSPLTEGEDKENVEDVEPPKIQLRYQYKEDQWSPLNIEGKKQYDRDFLLKMQSRPLSMTKPMNLPNLDVIKDKANLHRLTEINRVPMMTSPIKPHMDPFAPAFCRGSPRLPHPIPNRRGPKFKEPPPNRKVFNLAAMAQPVKLHEAEKAWKPMNKQDMAAIPMEEKEKEKLKRNVQSILNKLTPQKFVALVAQIQSLNIDTVDKLNIVIDLIFEKAVDEPNFSVPYANLCKSLALSSVSLPGQPNETVKFRKLLLTKCQREFEKDSSDKVLHEERMKAIEEADPAKRKELEAEYAEEEKKLRYRQLGNIRFIGELFKLTMLTETIMHECIKKLLAQGDEESLECLCKLLKTIGKELTDNKKSNKDKAKQDDLQSMDVYFNSMQRIVDKRLTSSRVRFMLQDVIELKKKNWVPRRDENNPKTIDEIHQDAEREAREQQQVLQNMSYNTNKRPTDERDRRKPGGPRVNVTEDGWTSTKTSKTSYAAVDPTKLRLTKPDEVESLRLGPQGRGLGAWARGSSGGNKAPEPDNKSTITANRYSALAEQPMMSSVEGRRESQRSAASSRESSRGRSNMLPPSMKKVVSQSKERENVLEAVKDLTRQANEPKVVEVQKNTETYLNGRPSDDFVLRGPEYSDEEIEKKTKPLIEEFIHNNDFEEAMRCVAELCCSSTVHLFINHAINAVLERSSQTRSSLGQLLRNLIRKKIITLEQYKNGFTVALECINDYALDIPKIWDYIGEILEPLLEDNELPLQFLKEVLQPCIPSNNAALIMSAILHCAAKRNGTISLGNLWKESGLLWSDFLGTAADIDDFVIKQRLDFTISPAKVEPNAQMSLDEVKGHLKTLLGENKENEEIFDWIDANVSNCTSPAFIRALVYCVHDNAITANDSESGTTYVLDSTTLKKRTPLLVRYIGHEQNLEVAAIFSIQSLMHQYAHPQGVMRQIVDHLYDDEVISDRALYEWEKDKDPSEGKQFAKDSVHAFFVWLHELDSNEA